MSNETVISQKQNEVTRLRNEENKLNQSLTKQESDRVRQMKTFRDRQQSEREHFISRQEAELRNEELKQDKYIENIKERIEKTRQNIKRLDDDIVRLQNQL